MTADGELLKRIGAKLEPSLIRSTLMYSAILQMVHEFIKQSVLNEVKTFYGYCNDLDTGHWLDERGKADYEKSVLSLSPGKTFKASTIWLERSGAITSAQRERLGEIYAYRHDLAHGIAGFIVDIDKDPDIEILADALQIFRAIDRFWIEVQEDTGSFDEHGDVDVERVLSGPTLMLQLCVDAYLGIDEERDSRVR